MQQQPAHPLDTTMGDIEYVQAGIPTVTLVEHISTQPMHDTDLAPIRLALDYGRPEVLDHAAVQEILKEASAVTLREACTIIAQVVDEMGDVDVCLERGASMDSCHPSSHPKRRVVSGFSVNHSEPSTTPTATSGPRTSPPSPSVNVPPALLPVNRRNSPPNHTTDSASALHPAYGMRTPSDRSNPTSSPSPPKPKPLPQPITIPTTSIRDLLPLPTPTWPPPYPTTQAWSTSARRNPPTSIAVTTLPVHPALGARASSPNPPTRAKPAWTAQFARPQGEHNTPCAVGLRAERGTTPSLPPVRGGDGSGDEALGASQLPSRVSTVEPHVHATPAVVAAPPSLQESQLASPAPRRDRAVSLSSTSVYVPPTARPPQWNTQPHPRASVSTHIHGRHHSHGARFAPAPAHAPVSAVRHVPRAEPSDELLAQAFFLPGDVGIPYPPRVELWEAAGGAWAAKGRGCTTGSVGGQTGRSGEVVECLGGARRGESGEWEGVESEGWVKAGEVWSRA